MTVELKARVEQQFHALLCIPGVERILELTSRTSTTYNLHVLGQIKFEVELPATDPLRHLSVFVEEGKSNLNDLQQINVTPEVNSAL